uniref:G-protein coupled receptors family 1 profile domain-containing protein n=1 Tax=Takifugu rubripes TaxID=31033 RepID=A0A674MKL0_TAKRU
MQALNLVVLAYDRLIAIMFPLHYPMMVTNRFMVSFIAVLCYCCIFCALFKLSTANERVKALKTCTGHLSLVALFFLPIIIVYQLQEALHPNIRILNLSLNYVIPPTLNPFIYALQTQEIKNSLKQLLKFRVQTKIVRKL